MKKFFSLVLALVMALSLTTVAWGAPVEVADEAGLIAALGNSAAVEIKLTAHITATGTPAAYGVQDGRYDISGKTIDLNGKTLTVVNESGKGNNMQFYGNNFTIKNGNITVTNGRYWIIGDYYQYSQSSNVVLDGLNVSAGINLYNVKDAVLSNNTVISPEAGTYPVYLESDGYECSATITSGSYTDNGTDAILYANTDASITVTGGTFTGTNAVSAATGATVTVKGGTFSDDVSEYVADGLEQDANGVVKAETTTPSAGTSTTKTIKADGYSLMDMDNAYSEEIEENFQKIVYNKLVQTSGVVTTTYYFADKYVIDGTECWACDSSIAEAKLVKNGKVVAFLTTTDLSAGMTKTATAFVKANVEPACGEYTEDTYVVNGKNYAKGSDEYVLYKGLAVGIEAAPSENVVPHIFEDENVTTDTKGKVVAIACDNCKKSFKVVDAIPAAYTGAVEAFGDQYILLGSVAASSSTTTITDKVTSAETFDAGIAMYVGMSVLAATGSAVVLKKKD